MVVNVRNGNRGDLIKEQGFTLVEVMVAIGILAFGILAVASMQSSSLLATTKSHSVTQATMVGTDRMERLMGLPFETLDPGSGNDSSSHFTDLPPVPPNVTSVTWAVTAGPSPLQDKIRIISITVQPKEMNNPIILTGVKTKV